MPKIFRIMKEEDGMPKLGNSSSSLGIRTPGLSRQVDITPDVSGNVHPGTGGMSVASSIEDLVARLAPTMIPERLQQSGIAPDAIGSNRLFIWSLGDGPFAPMLIGDSLRLAIDPDDATHGFVEPDRVMPLEEYIKALQVTQSEWKVDETA